MKLRLINSILQIKKYKYRPTNSITVDLAIYNAYSGVHL